MAKTTKVQWLWAKLMAGNPNRELALANYLQARFDKLDKDLSELKGKLEEVEQEIGSREAYILELEAQCF